MKISSIAGAAALFVMLPLTAPAAQTTSVDVPAGTAVNVRLTSDLSSRNVRNGDAFSFNVASDVRRDGWLVIPAGARGSGTIRNVGTTGTNGYLAKFDLEFDYVVAVDGAKVRLAPATVTVAGASNRGAAASHRWSLVRPASVSPSATFMPAVDRAVEVQAADRTNS